MSPLSDTTLVQPPTPRTDPEAPKARPQFERPTLRRRGRLPRVTTAFGGSFVP